MRREHLVLHVLTLAALILSLPGPLAARPAQAAPLLAVNDFSILLGRPEDDSITINIIPADTGEIAFEYGIASGVYGSPTAAIACTADVDLETVIDGLTSNTQYYYRLLYRATSGDPWTASDEHSFHTQRPTGSTFTFTLASDSHLGQYGGQTANELSLYSVTLANVAADRPDFHLDLGDTFPMDPSPLGTGMTEAEAKAAYLYQRPYLDAIGADIPYYQVLGNHENEEGWNWDDTFTAPDGSLAVRGIKQRKVYYPNPIPDGFYSGNTDTSNTKIEGDHLQEDYWAWTWGDALFVVIDPFHYSMVWPNDFGEGYGGEGQDGEVSGDRWDWSLGIQQYRWLSDTLKSSDATYKFVFTHQVAGGSTPYGRGGKSATPYFEWGGRNADGTWGWDTERPASAGWDVPVHQLMVDSGVDVFFHGHDHDFAFELADGIVYWECPKPDDAGYTWDPYSYGHNEGLYPDADELTNSGYTRVTVSPGQAHIEYVRSYLPGDGTNGEVAYSFNVPAGGLVQHTLTVGDDGNGSVTLSPSGGAYYSGTKVTLTPVPDSGMDLIGWVGPNASDISGSGPYTIIMDEDKSVTANFAPSSCSTANLEATADTYMRGGTNSTYNYGASSSIEATQAYQVVNRRGALYQWTLGSTCSGATVNAASITFYVTDTSTLVLNLYNMRRSWAEGSGNGSATADGATWDTYDGNTSHTWATGGAASTTSDRYDVNLWDATASTFASTGSVRIPLNGNGGSVVQGWINGTTSNYGLTLQNYGTSTQDAWIVASRTHPSYAGPTLNITCCIGSNQTPGAEPVWPANRSTGIGLSPSLEITATDSDSNRVDVSFYGAISSTLGGTLSREAGSLAGAYLGTAYAVPNAGHATVVWPDLTDQTWYQWYVVVSDGAITTTVPSSGYWSFKTGDPTAAELTSLAANPGRGGILLRWATASDASNLGFHVWRATSANGEPERLTASLIPSQAPGSTFGGRYQFVDDGAQPGLTYYYWVEIVTADGATQLHGPVSARASLYIKAPPPRD